jgi:hypothetical protein
MTQQELQALIAPLSEEERRYLRDLLDAPAEDDPVYRIAEAIESFPVSDNVPHDFAENHDKYIHGQVLNHD